MGGSEIDRQELVQLSSLCTFPMAIRSAILLEVPQILYAANSALSAKQIADRIPGRSTSEEKLERLLHALATYGIFNVSSDGFYSINGMSKLLVTDENGLSLAPMFLLTTDSLNLEPLRHLHDAILDDAVVPFQKAFGQPLYQHVAQKPEMGDVLRTAMDNLSAVILKSILQRYEGFKGVNVLVDVGGGTGSNSGVIIAANPHISAINFDLPFVVAKAPQVPGVEHRGGSMFDGVPTGGDAILLQAVLHNWDDESCSKILHNCYSALPDNGKVIIMEALKPEKPDSTCGSRLVATLDMTMMAVFRGGKERTSKQFEKLLQSAGFNNFQIVLYGDLLSVMEGHKAGTATWVERNG